MGCRSQASEFDGTGGRATTAWQRQVFGAKEGGGSKMVTSEECDEEEEKFFQGGGRPAGRTEWGESLMRREGGEVAIQGGESQTKSRLG